MTASMSGRSCPSTFRLTTRRGNATSAFATQQSVWLPVPSCSRSCLPQRTGGRRRFRFAIQRLCLPTRRIPVRKMMSRSSGRRTLGLLPMPFRRRRASDHMVIVGKTQGRERSEVARRAEGQTAAMAQKQVGDGGHASSRHILCQPNSRVHCTHLVVAACACVHQTSRGRCGTLPHCTAAPVECRVYWTVLFGC